MGNLSMAVPLSQVFTDELWRSLMVLSGLAVVLALYLGYGRKHILLMRILLVFGVLLFVFLTIFWKNFAVAEYTLEMSKRRQTSVPIPEWNERGE